MTLDQFHKAHNEQKDRDRKAEKNGELFSLEQRNEIDRLNLCLKVGKELNNLRKEMVVQKYTLWKDLPWLHTTAWI